MLMDITNAPRNLAVWTWGTRTRFMWTPDSRHIAFSAGET